MALRTIGVVSGYSLAAMLVPGGLGGILMRKQLVAKGLEYDSSAGGTWLTEQLYVKQHPMILDMLDFYMLFAGLAIPALMQAPMAYRAPALLALAVMFLYNNTYLASAYVQEATKTSMPLMWSATFALMGVMCALVAIMPDAAVSKKSSNKKE